PPGALFWRKRTLAPHSLEVTADCGYAGERALRRPLIRPRFARPPSPARGEGRVAAAAFRRGAPGAPRAMLFRAPSCGGIATGMAEETEQPAPAAPEVRDYAGALESFVAA